MKKIIYTLVLCFILISCKEEVKKVDSTIEVSTEEIAANLKSIEVEIEGMTCEIGCARLIQSKLSKVDGVTYTKVSFESGKGQFTFDSNKLSPKDISNKISSIAGGDLYSVSNTKELDIIFE
jgi:Cu+-exporting ATPase